jgi:hypothetical protein
MKLTIEKLRQIIREEVENATNEAWRPGDDPAMRPGRARVGPSRREKWADRADPAYRPRKRKVVRVTKEVLGHIKDFFERLPESPGAPAGATLKDLGDFFRQNRDFYKDMVRQANIAYVEAGPEDKINSALHDDLFDKIDAELGLKILTHPDLAPN